LRCSHCAFLIEGRWALRSCGSPSVAWQPMLCQRGLAPFYRPAIRAVQTAQELQIVRGAVLGFEEVVRAPGPHPTATDLLLAGANPWPSRWLLSDGMADGGACLQTHCRLAGWYGPITCRGLQAQDRVLAHAARRAPCPGPCTCQIICGAGHQNASFGAGQDRAALR
jgi:hypothetical protein